MHIRGVVVFGSHSSGDPVRQITEIAPFRLSITSPVQEVRDARLVSMFNGSMKDSWTGTSLLRIPEASKDKTGLRCNSPPQA